MFIHIDQELLDASDPELVALALDLLGVEVGADGIEENIDAFSSEALARAVADLLDLCCFPGYVHPEKLTALATFLRRASDLLATTPTKD